MDEMGKFGWIALAVFGFWLRWPIGLAVLLFLIFSGRIRAWRCASRGQWYNTNQGASAMPWGKWGCGSGNGHSRANYKPSGNAAFDAYRQETLRRLEEEQSEFQAYLERLRQARDKQEFDQFMAERRNRNGGSNGVPQAPAETV
ncbi:MAG: DUF2852 domain-containing protein [Acetobacteraceae bacterium]|nr:DUF2852 domain-containing protein [Acetobacteraceae bacterium]